MALVVTHEFEACEYKEEQKANDKEAKVAVGSTATGKSTLIQLFCGGRVVVGHGTQSQTTQSTLFREVDSTDKYWLDSQGANDSRGVEDEKVLTDILRKLYEEGIRSVKVVWCVSGDFCRETQVLQAQARFITSLGDNIWQSCLIIKKRGHPKPEEMNGVLAACNRFGANITASDSVHLFGYTCLERIDASKDRLLRQINKISNLEERKRDLKEHGYFTDHEIVAEVRRKLTGLPLTQIVFDIQRCSKCGITGDARFVFAPCHTLMEKFHASTTPMPYHSGSIRHFHAGALQNYHPSGIQTTYTHEWYHPGKIDDHTARNVSLHFLTFGIHTIARAATDTMESWTCCDRKTGASGCRKRISGAITKFSCCGGHSSSQGCRQRYGCCSRPHGSAGCRTDWTCCNASQENTGCRRRHQCCSRDEGNVGCRDRCQSCHRAWGSSDGCTRTANRL